MKLWFARSFTVLRFNILTRTKLSFRRNWQYFLSTFAETVHYLSVYQQKSDPLTNIMGLKIPEKGERVALKRDNRLWHVF